MSNHTTSKLVTHTALHNLEACVNQIIGHYELAKIEIPGIMPQLGHNRVDNMLLEICRILEEIHFKLMVKNSESVTVDSDSLLRIIGYTCEFTGAQLSSLSSTIGSTRKRRRYVVNILACGTRICVLEKITWSEEESSWIHEKIEDMRLRWEADEALSNVEKSLIQQIRLSSSSFDTKNVDDDRYSATQKTLNSSKEALSTLSILLKESRPYTMSSAREFWILYDWSLFIAGDAERSDAKIFHGIALDELNCHADRVASYPLVKYLLEEIYSRFSLPSGPSSDDESYLTAPVVEKTHTLKQSADMSYQKRLPYPVMENSNRECVDEETNDPTLSTEDTNKPRAEDSVRPGQTGKNTSKSHFLSTVQDIPQRDDLLDYDSFVQLSVMPDTQSSPLDYPSVGLRYDGPSRAMAVRKHGHTQDSSDGHIYSTRTIQAKTSHAEPSDNYRTSTPTPQHENAFERSTHHRPQGVARENSISGLEVCGAHVDYSTDSEKIFVPARDTVSVKTSSSISNFSIKTRNQLSRLFRRTKHIPKPPKPVLPEDIQFCFSSCTQHIWFWCKKDPDSLVRLRDPFKDGQRFSIDHQDGLNNTMLKRNIRHLSATRDIVVMVLNLDESPWLYSLQDNAFQPLLKLDKNVLPILALAVSPDGKNIALGYGTVTYVYKVSNGELGPPLTLKTTAACESASSMIQRLSFSIDSRRLVCALQSTHESNAVIVHIDTWASAGAEFQQESAWTPVNLADGYSGTCSVTAISLIDDHQILLTAVSASNPTIVSDKPDVKNKVIDLAGECIEASSQCHLSPDIFAVQSGRNQILLINSTSSSFREVVDLSTVRKKLPSFPSQVSIAVPDDQTVLVIWRAIDRNVYLITCKLGSDKKWTEEIVGLGSIYLGLTKTS